MTKKIRLPPPNEHFRRRALDGMEIDTPLTKESVAELYKVIFAAKKTTPKPPKRTMDGKFASRHTKNYDLLDPDYEEEDD